MAVEYARRRVLGGCKIKSVGRRGGILEWVGVLGFAKLLLSGNNCVSWFGKLGSCLPRHILMRPSPEDVDVDAALSPSPSLSSSLSSHNISRHPKQCLRFRLFVLLNQLYIHE